MGWWLAGGTVLLVIVISGGLLWRGALEAGKEDARQDLRRWGPGGRPPREDD